MFLYCGSTQRRNHTILANINHMLLFTFDLVPEITRYQSAENEVVKARNATHNIQACVLNRDCKTKRFNYHLDPCKAQAITSYYKIWIKWSAKNWLLGKCNTSTRIALWNHAHLISYFPPDFSCEWFWLELTSPFFQKAVHVQSAACINTVWFMVNALMPQLLMNQRETSIAILLRWIKRLCDRHK